MNKKTIFSGAFILVTLTTILWLMLNKSQVQPVNIKNDQYVTFKIKFDIKLKDPNLVPQPILYQGQLTTEKKFLKSQKLSYLYKWFDVSVLKNFQTTKVIELYPDEEVEIAKTSRYKVDVDFFLSRGISLNNSKKTVAILANSDEDLETCFEKLKKIYIGNEYNKDFFMFGLPKLIY
ncbi:hypothetical protein SCLARK_00953 [Spiroplasma clarkii]|uniref:Uncharacterized protein n=1 Tax=Spiroplasma clarkii TaxID=2139 RepID=A0A1Y0L1A7_9MOLU|nr:hypothetical protein [Spiroplasma clarkii]ARU91560.1 hypothetical protein SCLARK_00953 [Spiroplasma clarkii]ATX70960.1 hypothetical protein SCLAR_v1c06430 [Spiroplasma clarkii]